MKLNKECKIIGYIIELVFSNIKHNIIPKINKRGNDCRLECINEKTNEQIRIEIIGAK